MRVARWLGSLTPIRWLSRRPWTLAMVMWVVLAVPGFVVVQHNNAVTEGFVDCLTGWANETSGRSSVLTKATQDRDEAIGRVIRDAAHGDRDAIIRDLALYVEVDDARRALLAANPIPDPPVLRCRR